MARSKIHVGLEIGTSKTCMVVGEAKPDGSLTVLGVGETRSAGIRKGEITDLALVRECVSTAWKQAQDHADVDISAVYLAVTGGHIVSLNNRGTFRLPDSESVVTEKHIQEVQDIASAAPVPADHVILHRIERKFSMDGKEDVSNPLGFSCQTLDIDFHIVHGIKTRIQNSVRCVRDIPLEIEEVVFAPLAAAQVALDRARKEQGALLIDIGGGTTDFVLYLDGSPVCSGCVPVGGDHITNDLHVATGLSWARAEQLKKTEADANPGMTQSAGVVRLPSEMASPEAEIERQLINEIVRVRLEETLYIVKKMLPENSLQKVGAGIFLCGGTSLLRGLGELAYQIFDLPVYRPERAQTSGTPAYLEDPRFCTAIGLIRYAQILDSETPEPGSIQKVVRGIKSIFFGK